MSTSIADEKWLTRMLLVLPGFFSVAIARHVGHGPEIDEFSLVSYSLAFSLFNFVLALLLYRAIVAASKFRRGRESVTVSAPMKASVPFMATVLFLAVVLGVLAGYVYASDMMLTSLRHGPYARVFAKRSVDRPLVFLLEANRRGALEEGRPKAMKEGQAWINVHLKGGEVFSGYPEFFPMGEEKGELFLSPACSVNAGGKSSQWLGPGVLIPEDEIYYLGFIDRESSECHNIWKAVSAGLAAGNQSPLRNPAAPASVSRQ